MAYSKIDNKLSLLDWGSWGLNNKGQKETAEQK